MSGPRNHEHDAEQARLIQSGNSPRERDYDRAVAVGTDTHEDDEFHDDEER